jgi:hypothetical protein
MYTVAFDVMACGFVLGEYLVLNLNLMAVKASWTGNSTSFQSGCFTCGAESFLQKRDPCGFIVSQQFLLSIFKSHSPYPHPSTLKTTLIRTPRSRPKPANKSTWKFENISLLEKTVGMGRAGIRLC